LVKPWDDQFSELLSKKYPGLNAKYANAFPDHYKTRRSTDQAFIAVEKFEKMEATKSIQFAFIPFKFKGSLLDNISSLLTIYSTQKIDLIYIMPILQNLGLHVYDEYISKVNNKDNVIGFIHSFRVADQHQEKIDEEKYVENLIDLLKRVFHKETSNDPLIGLVLKTKLTWRCINVLEMYRNFFLQLKAPYHADIINNSLLKHPEIAEIIYEYFETKFNPSISSKSKRQKQLSELRYIFSERLRDVQSVSEDVILRRFINMIDGTLRTNFFIGKTNNDTFISIKVDSSKLDQMPRPVPYREIYVYDVGVEGTHLRFGPVARGGLRWSTRLSDFRTEVLGLVKTQQSKNVVIVPVGSKGGFIVKEYINDRDLLMQEAQKQYKKFISGLLDITDSIGQDGKTSLDPKVLCYDEPDPYLVVAADKGTASFSDLANDVSQSYDFWLDDAFASGGSHGYNHKEVGITAKGAWECVKLHFLERGHDTQTQDFTVAGVGDMSGDVFGNGMLLSNCIRLQAAFNHIHIFIDPNPDAKTSFKERERLFNLPRSTWEDYNSKLISKGGGVFDRKAKAIPISKEMKALLGIKADELNGEELIRAILKMNVDLMWFGGIGTYIKSSFESHNDVGDPPNDSVRIDAPEFQARVIGEGANLGVTQRARVDLSLQGVSLNSDAIDNSAGVNMSDYEVNIKILLQNLMAQNVIKSQKKRNHILESATDEVTELVLENNRGQHQLISIDTVRSRERFDMFNNLIRYLIAEGIMDTKSEFSPPQVVLDEWRASKKPLTRSLLGGYQAYVKMMVANALITTDLLDHAHWDEMYVNYFPKSIQKSFESHIMAHQLKKEIICTQITNNVVNQAGSTFFYEVLRSTGCGVADAVVVYEILTQAIKTETIRDLIFTDNVSQQSRYEALLYLEKKLRKCCISILSFGDMTLQLDHIPVVKNVVKELQRADVPKQLCKQWISKGFSEKSAKILAQIDYYTLLPDVLHLHLNEKLNVEKAHLLSQSVDSLFQFEYIKQAISNQKFNNSWDNTLKEQLINRLRSHKLYIIRFLVEGKRLKTADQLNKKSIQVILKDSFESQLDLYFKSLKYINTLKTPSISQFSVIVNHLNNLRV
jgi:glutamate dehydrogenase